MANVRERRGGPLLTAAALGEDGIEDPSVPLQREPKYGSCSKGAFFAVCCIAFAVFIFAYPAALKNVSLSNRVLCQTTKGEFEIELDFESAPHGAAQIKRMVDLGFFNDEAVPFFRVNKYITQFGVLPSREHRGIKSGDKDPFEALRKDWEQDIHPYCLRERTAEQCEDKKDKKSVLLRKSNPWKRGHHCCHRRNAACDRPKGKFCDGYEQARCTCRLHRQGHGYCNR